MFFQGRLPIRVTLKGLDQEDLYRILTEPVTNLIRQQIEMLKSEHVTLSFTDGAIKEIARVAFEVNIFDFAILPIYFLKQENLLAPQPTTNNSLVSPLGTSEIFLKR